MTFSLSLICLLVLGYLGLLYLAVHSVEHGWVPKRWVQQPAMYLLSLGVYASAWGYYGIVALGEVYGLGYLSYFAGLSGAFLLAPVLLRPIFHITRSFQLGSLADLMAFRFCSPTAGKLVAFVMMIMVVPLITLQIKALTETLAIVSPGWNNTVTALAFTGLLAVATILFGARHIALRHNHEGLVFALAVETIVKLGAVTIGGIALMFWFIPEMPGGDQWRLEIIDYLQNRPLSPPEGPALALLPMCLAIAICMPHTFHMTFTENESGRALKTAAWAFPLLVLLMTLMIPPLIWAGHNIDFESSEYYSIKIAMFHESPVITMVFFFGGIAAATGVTIQMTLVSSTMLLNHLLTPHFGPGPNYDIYHWLLRARRALIVIILLSAFIFYVVAAEHIDLNRLGILASGVALQFAPGIVGLLYWRSANRQGFLTGLAAGVGIWVVSMFIPLVFDLDRDGLLLGIQYPDESNWHLSAIFSIVANFVFFLGVSQNTAMRENEREAAESCRKAKRKDQRPLIATSSNHAIAALSRPLGRYMAEREVLQALDELGLPSYEDRPHELRRLRMRLEANLSTLMGQTVAEDIIERYLPLNTGKELDNDFYMIEQRLEGFHDRLSGLSAELDNMRRYHRDTLERLPIGACSLAADGEILLWNRVMVEMTGIPAERVNGTMVEHLPAPWGDILGGFMAEFEPHQYKRQIEINGSPRWYNLHKSILKARPGQPGGMVLVLEDQTDTQLLERELIHSERLASVGRLAAGVAHEIGNPITGIDCLAQSIRYETEDPELKDIADQIREQTERVSRILQSLMNFSHAGNHSTEREAVCLYDCVEDAMSLLRLSQKSDAYALMNECDKTALVTGDMQRLVQVFINLLTNARDASDPGSWVRVETQIMPNQIMVQVTDQGHGIPQEVQDRVFEPFFTTKEVGKGTGLGLSLVYSIVEEHYGQVQIQSPINENGGTCVKVTLPRYLQDRLEPHS